MVTTAADLARLLKAKRCGSGWTARCPAHEDRRESLSISEGENGRLLLKCFAGCDFADILKAAGAEPAKPNGADRPHTKARKMDPIVATYDYTDSRGEIVFQVCRTDPKGFFQRRPNGHGGWINGRGDTPNLPYRLPEILDSLDTVFVVEGEKDVDSLRSLGLTATTNAGGAESEWPEAWGRYFDGRHVVIIPDNDDAGRKHARDVARKLNGKAATVKLLELPDLPPKGDVSKWLDQGGTAEQLIDLANQVLEWDPGEGDGDLTFDQVDGEAEPFEVDTITTIMNAPPRITLVKGFAGRGELILFYGPPKHGKTFLTSHFALSVAVQANWFGRKHKAPAGFILYCALEGGSGMRQRLKAILQHDPALGDRITDQNLKIMRKRIDLRQPGDVARLLATIAKHERETSMPCLLVVVDTIARALGSGNDTDPKDMSALISASDTIRQAGSQPTVALIHHAGKDVNRGPRGRSDLPGAIDTCVLVERLDNGAGNRATCEYAKDDPDGWAIDFRLEQVEIDTDEDGDLITTCVLREGEAHQFAPPKTKAGSASKPYRGERQRIFVRQLCKLAAKHPEGVERSLLRSHFLCELNAERQRDGQEPLNLKLGASTFRQVLLHLRDRNPPLFTEDANMIHPAEGLS